MSDDTGDWGEWHKPVNCPTCGTFMRTSYDGVGHPSVSCPNGSCEVRNLGIQWLLDNGYWEE